MNYTIDRLLRLVVQLEAEDPALLAELEREFPNEMSALEAGDDGLIPDFQIKAMVDFIENCFAPS